MKMLWVALSVVDLLELLLSVVEVVALHWLPWPWQPWALVWAGNERLWQPMPPRWICCCLRTTLVVLVHCVSRGTAC